MNLETNYKKVSKIIDINSFIDYQIAEMFLGNEDWPANNAKLWKPNMPNSKWRFIFYDLDAAFKSEEKNMFEYCLDSNSSDWQNDPESTLLFRKLIQNENFKTKFILRYEELLQNKFSSEQTIPKLNRIVKIINPEFEKNYERWRYPYSYYFWISEIHKKMNSFLLKRPCIVSNQLNAIFDLKNTKCDSKIDKNIFYTIYPNPNNGNFSIYINSENTSTQTEYILYNQIGEIVKSEKLFLSNNNSFQIKNLNLANGVYFLKLIDVDQNFAIQKLIIKN